VAVRDGSAGAQEPGKVEDTTVSLDGMRRTEKAKVLEKASARIFRG
jgi:hypothetical protein